MPYQVKPLAFDPARLNALSERLIVSHWENNYGGVDGDPDSALTARVEREFGARAVAYVDALMQNLSWTAAEIAFAKVEG